MMASRTSAILAACSRREHEWADGGHPATPAESTPSRGEAAGSIFDDLRRDRP